MTDAASGGADEAERWQAEVRVTHGAGLHARPSVIFTRLARSYPCQVEFAVDGDGAWLNGKSIVRVMGARVRSGSVLGIRAEGVGAREAVHALKSLVERNFDEETERVASA